MKYQLINPINSKYTTVEQILTNRQIPIEQIKHYLKTTEQDINPPELLGQEALRRAAALISQTVQANKEMVVIVD